jgi:hypothetical protein
MAVRTQTRIGEQGTTARPIILSVIFSLNKLFRLLLMPQDET